MRRIWVFITSENLFLKLFFSLGYSHFKECTKTWSITFTNIIKFIHQNNNTEFRKFTEEAIWYSDGFCWNFNCCKFLNVWGENHFFFNITISILCVPQFPCHQLVAWWCALASTLYLYTVVTYDLMHCIDTAQSLSNYLFVVYVKQWSLSAQIAINYIRIT